MRNYVLKTAVFCVCAVAATTAMADDAAQEKTTLGGRAFIDLTNVNFKNDDVKQAASGTGVDVKRGYIMLGHIFDDMWSANLTTDFNYSSSTGETQVYIKKAYVQAKLSDAFFARLGSADMAWIPFVEDLYGYRYVEKLLVDRVGYGTTADWGLHVGGKLADGMFSYAASGVNGNGYKNPTRSNSMDFEARVAFMPIKGLTFAIGGYSGELGLDTAGLAPANQPRGAERWDAFAGYANSTFRIGTEYFQATDWKILNSAASDKADGYSIWGAFNFTSMVSAFARYDQVKPSKDVLPNKKDTYFNAGVAFKPRKNIDLAFAYKHEKVENGAFKTADVTLGTTAGLESTYSEVGFWMQVNF